MPAVGVYSTPFGKSVHVKSFAIARTMTAGTDRAFALPRGTRILAMWLSGTASDAGTTATLSVGTTSGTPTEYANALDVKANSGNGTTFIGEGRGGAIKMSATLTPAIVAANTSAEQTFTVNGLLTTDVVYVNKPTAQAGLGIVGARVSAANTLAITFGNFTAVGITPTAGEVYTISVTRAGGSASVFGSKMTNDTIVYVKYAETGTASTVGSWVLHVIYTTAGMNGAGTE